MELLISKKIVLIDDEDYDKISAYKWHISGAHGNDYVIHTMPRDGNKRPQLRMHRLILDAPKGMDVDHINGNRYDNRKSNLRLCKHKENCRNSRLSALNQCRLKGASFHSSSNKWQSQINIDGKVKYLGIYNTPEEAHERYCEAAIEYFGEFANLG